MILHILRNASKITELLVSMHVVLFVKKVSMIITMYDKQGKVIVKPKLTKDQESQVSRCERDFSDTKTKRVKKNLHRLVS